MSSNPRAGIPSPSAPIWQNWSGNLVHHPPADGLPYYYAPANLAELQKVLADAAKVTGATVRVSGQRHSQPPLVADDNRNAVPQTPISFVVDMSCYADLGSGQERLVPGPGKNQVTVNAGVREDELDAFLTQNNLMLKTATAGGFFSLGGMTAVDVHGATVNEKIFAETVSAFTILLADGSVKTIDAHSPQQKAQDGSRDWSPLQFARVSLGGLGIVTSVTIDVLPRPYATTLRGGYETQVIATRSDFVSKFQTLLTSHDRVEVFFTPYANIPSVSWMGNPAFLVLWWDIDNNPAQPAPNQPPSPYPPTACNLASEPKPVYGAPDLFSETAAALAAKTSNDAQFFNNWLVAGGIVGLGAFSEIKTQVENANKSHSELWLAASVRCIFMSYFIPLPAVDAAGLGKVWDGLDVVARIVQQDGNFHIAAPMEFRIVKGGDSAMSGAYSEDPNTWFVNLDLIGWVDAYNNQKASDYPPQLLKFFAAVEREWVRMGGFPHNGKMYGFYDPTTPDTRDAYSQTGPFNANFLDGLRKRRGARLEAFNAYRKSLDPNGLFYNSYLRQLLEST